MVAVDRPTRLPLVEVSGSRRAIGFALGRFRRAVVAERIRPSKLWHDCAALADGTAVAAMLAAARAAVPELVAELEGLAEGLDLPFAAVFAWHCRGDLAWAAGEGCTTVRATTPTGGLVVHNEDGDPDLFGDCLLVRLAPTDGPVVTAFAYPGSLPGNAFGVNDRGLGASVNNIRVRDGRAGVPRLLVGRAVLDCASIEKAVARVAEMERASGYNLNLLAAGAPGVVGLEFTATRVSARPVETVSAHANHALHDDVARLPQVVTASSAARQARAEALLDALGRAPSAAEARAVIADRVGDLPIRRSDPADPDGENTIAAAVLESDPRGLSLAVFGGLDDAPLHRFRIPLPAGAAV